MKFNRKDFFTIFLVFISLTTVGIFYKVYFKPGLDKKIEIKSKEKDAISTENTNNTIFVYIDGAVKNPGLYEMKNNDRIKHLVDIAGGFLEEADLSKINLAIKLKDEMKVHIFKIGENKESHDNHNNDGNLDKPLININTANKEELMKITGIGEIKAEQIIKYREKAKFNKIEDITKVNGIGKKTFEKIKNEITVD